MTNIEGTNKELARSDGGFFSKLVNGDFGLAGTYWGFGVLVGLVVNLASRAITSSSALAIVTLAYTAYQVLVLTGVWRAANRYTGFKLWAVLAKIAVVLACIFLVFGLLAAVTLL